MLPGPPGAHGLPSKSSRPTLQLVLHTYLEAKRSPNNEKSAVCLEPFSLLKNLHQTSAFLSQIQWISLILPLLLLLCELPLPKAITAYAVQGEFEVCSPPAESFFFLCISTLCLRQCIWAQSDLPIRTAQHHPTKCLKLQQCHQHIYTLTAWKHRKLAGKRDKAWAVWYLTPSRKQQVDLK